ncbi:hypothetical protein F5Y08DRAFT_266665 [Xylaria arbuscula]|nr:hypothetical protein F5Y08DRAFT_266665 [Xylaria arbuscula]
MIKQVTVATLYTIQCTALLGGMMLLIAQCRPDSASWLAEEFYGAVTQKRSVISTIRGRLVAFAIRHPSFDTSHADPCPSLYLHRIRTHRCESRPEAGR